MCGFAGLLHPGGHDLDIRAAAMASALVHRGPDDHGVFTDVEAGYAVAFRRLSIRDLSGNGHQPMTSRDGRWVLAFNGEIYFLDEARAAVEAAGCGPWVGRSDTEVLLQSIALWGVQGALERLEGMFAVAVWDRQRRELTLARDRMGEKPLFWGRVGSAVLFGSELPALRRWPGWVGGVDRVALAGYLRQGWIAAPRTIHPGIFKVRPGHMVTVAADGTMRGDEAYWTAAAELGKASSSPFAGGVVDAADELERLLLRSVRARLHADVPVGAFLSGGIDSSAVVAMMQATGVDGVSSFAIGFEDPRYDESPFAEGVARSLGVSHHTLRMTEADARALIPRMATVSGEPFADPSLLPTLLLCQGARSHVTVALAGDGGDELFGGYARFSDVARQWERRLPSSLSCIAGHVARALPVGFLDRRVCALGRVLGSRRDSRPVARLRRTLELWAARSPARLMELHHSPWRDDLPFAVTADDLLPGLPVPDLEDPALAAMVVEALTYLPDDLLVKVDRASMAASLEVRLPFLDLAVMRHAWSLPTSFKMEGSVTKKVLRSVLHRHVPPAQVERPKMGFEPPVGAWMRGPLRDWVDGLLDPHLVRHQGILDADAVCGLWQAFRDGRSRQVLPVWHLVMFQAWMQDEGASTVG
ncbi:asparagine synthase (glutamine-hydrolyzing) [Haematospirillum sp. H1815]|uniref:asparagine synthase (glutamine-hydrolyzing) n=1 Tax=Haematospirillum sp. H1815 TaxID=2723108 RepID=UPI00143B2F00|nr:asparagine synthase (glutamine-hydrolyzing) [Haematospirillum sp. H1815]NKD76958.1 asparagine synthase (glutamine-hydrolyzing) [Haematospirillum sp. H1815]